MDVYCPQTAHRSEPSLRRKAPRRAAVLTNRLLELLCQASEGLSRVELLAALYEARSDISSQRRASLDACVRKLVQRARVVARSRGQRIVFDPSSRRWKIIVALTRL